MEIAFNKACERFSSLSLFCSSAQQEMVLLDYRPNVQICPAALPTLIKTFYLVG